MTRGEERAEYRAAYYRANKERAAETARAYQEANKERIREHRRNYRMNEEAKAIRAEWIASNRDRVKANNKRDRERNADTRRNRDFVVKYGITIDDYYRMFDEQGGVCAVCFRPPNAGRRMAVDHDHNTGAIRGLLCNSCNLALGHLQYQKITL